MRVQSVDINLAPASRAKAAQIFSGMQPGDSVHAELTAVNGSRIEIKTGDGKTIQADFRGNVQFQPGDKLDLMLDARQGNSVSLRLLSLNGQPVRLDVSARENLLMRAGIDPSALNVRLSGILQENGFLPNAQNISNLARIVQDHPNLPTDISAFLAANNLKPDEQTLGRINQLISEAPQTGNRAEQLTAAFTQLLAEIKTASGLQAGKNAPAGASVLPTVQPDAQTAQTVPAGGNALPEARISGNAATQTDTGQLFRALSLLAGPDTGLAAIKNLVSGGPQVQSGQPAQAGAQTGTLLEVIRLLASLPEQEAKNALATLAARDPQNAGTFSVLLSFLNLPVQERQSMLGTLPGMAGENLGWMTGNAQTVQPAVTTQGTAVPENSRGAAETGVQPQAGTASDAISNKAQSGQTSPAIEAAAGLLRKLDGLFLHLTPDNIPALAEELRQTVLNQEKLAESIGSDISQLAGDKSVLARQAGELHTQVQFTSGLEQFFYFQIPIRFENRSSTAELYIFERSGREKSNREINTILIALETQNLGRVETVLRCEGSGLDVSIRLNSEALSNYLKDRSGELKQALAESGFQVKNMQFGLIQKKTTLLNAQELFSKENRIPAVGLDIQV